MLSLEAINQIKRHATFLVSIVALLGLIIHVISMNWLIRRIETLRCSCSSSRVEANGNVNHLQFQNDPTTELTRQILIKRGFIDGNVPRTSSSEGQSGCSDNHSGSRSGGQTGSISSRPDDVNEPHK